MTCNIDALSRYGVDELRRGDTLVVWRLDRPERTRHGLAAARARGRKGGRRPASPKAVETALKMYASGLHGVPDILKATGLSKTTLYKTIRQQESQSFTR